MNQEASRPELDRRQILAALKTFRSGDFSVRLPLHFDGLDGEIAEAFNEIVQLNEQVTKEFDRLSRVVGKDGKIGERAHVARASGSWGASNMASLHSRKASATLPSASSSAARLIRVGAWRGSIAIAAAKRSRASAGRPVIRAS